ncbi:DUF2382 domain-containing protein [Crocosphaera chwakensis]|uniref:DUF2382 domain-containing protein n=1 Tax=Crocosphaera chwakensis CCY0110 TaxID=391612 RepID=A3IPA3_9CHRO|nr:DUF2382 domain-containing protein [Crocosphaera chwakensis]EAZ91668.1 hypothetical protein CY0110_26093 [Crocosphaera chwakensis CCY0110]
MESPLSNHNSDNNEEQIKLLQERLKVEREQEKVGEVVVRKETETKVAFVPLQQEKLIVEQVNADNSQVEKIAEVDLKKSNVKKPTVNSKSSSTIQARFDCLQEAKDYLRDIAPELSEQITEVEIKLTINDNKNFKTSDSS